MSEISEVYVRTILKQVAIKNNLEEWTVSQQNFDAIAQNYFGVLIPVILQGKTNGENKEFNLVLKLAPTDERYRVSGALTLFFEKEVFVYSVILKEYRDLQKSFPIALKLVLPECYFLRAEFCQEAIVMENMCAIGYKPYPSGFLDLDHMAVSLRSLAKFHALSFVLKEKYSSLYEEVADKCVPLNKNTNKRFMEILNDRLVKALGKFEGTEYIPLLENLKRNRVKFVEAIATEVKRTAICHGDIWKENILFKYQDGSPVSACLIDFQTVRMSSPAYDILYLIISSSNAELRRSHFKILLDIYYQTFELILREANMNACDVYSRGDFESDLKVVSPACLIVANTALWLSNGLQVEGHVRSKKILKTEEEKTEAIENYKTVVKNIIVDLQGYGYLTNI